MLDFRNLSVKAVKSVLFLFNLFFAFTGLILLCMGIMIKEYFIQYEAFIDDKYFSASSLLIATGSIIFVISFFGCCGALRENRCMVLTYSVLLTLIMILEFASGVTGYVLTGETTELMEIKLNESLYNYNKNYDVTVLWDTVQSQFECCGLYNYSDWARPFKNNSLPVSCCSFAHGSLDSWNCSVTSPTLYKLSCKERLSLEVEEHTLMLGCVAFGIIGAQFLGILFACYLSKSIKQSSYETV
uniref:Tetraspanin n=1 Tax=Riptortus pedestris TaxID=329032 RepID=R4WD91_RIPPE|nr:tetraspanin 29fb [Riptortus pedestris]